MTLEERLAHLLEEHGRGCPRAVSLGGPAAVEAWCEQQELDIEAAAEAEAVAEVSAEADAIADGEPGTGRPFGTPDTIEAIHGRLDALESRVSEIEAVIADSPTEEAVGEVAAGGGDPEPEGTKAPATTEEPPPTERPKAEKPKAGKKGGKGK